MKREKGTGNMDKDKVLIKLIAGVLIAVSLVAIVADYNTNKFKEQMERNGMERVLNSSETATSDNVKSLHASLGEERKKWATEKYNEYIIKAKDYVTSMDSMGFNIDSSTEAGDKINSAVFTKEIQLSDIERENWELVNGLGDLREFDETVNMNMINRSIDEEMECRIKCMGDNSTGTGTGIRGNIITYLKTGNNFDLEINELRNGYYADRLRENEDYSKISKGDELETILNVLAEKRYTVLTKGSEFNDRALSIARRHQNVQVVKAIKYDTLDNILCLKDDGEWELTIRVVSESLDSEIVYKVYRLISEDKKLSILEYEMNIINLRVLQDRYISEFSKQ